MNPPWFLEHPKNRSENVLRAMNKYMIVIFLAGVRSGTDKLACDVAAATTTTTTKKVLEHGVRLREGTIGTMMKMQALTHAVSLKFGKAFDALALVACSEFPAGRIYVVFSFVCFSVELYIHPIKETIACK